MRRMLSRWVNPALEKPSFVEKLGEAPSFGSQVWHNKWHAFTLVEIVIALGLISFVLMALLGLSSVGMQSLQESGHDDITGEIFKDARKRIMGQALPNAVTSPNGVVISLYYSRNGLWLDQSRIEMVTQNFYRVQITLKKYSAPFTTKIDDGGMAAAIFKVQWPIQPVADGGLEGTPDPNNTREATLLMATGSTLGWTEVDPNYLRELTF